MSIEVFDGGGPSFEGEEAVLAAIANLLQVGGEDAVILTNVRIIVPKAVRRRTAEIDLFAYFSDRRWSNQADGGRRFSVIMDALGVRK